MVKYILKRLVQLVVVLLGVTETLHCIRRF